MVQKQKKSPKKPNKPRKHLMKHNKRDKQFMPLYEVEYIVDRRVDEKGEFEYLIKWQGYPTSQNSWEPKSNLEFSKDLINAYDLQFDLKRLERKKDASTNTQEPFVKHDAVKILAHITKPTFQYYVCFKNYKSIKIVKGQRGSVIMKFLLFFIPLQLFNMQTNIRKYFGKTEYENLILIIMLLLFIITNLTLGVIVQIKRNGKDEWVNIYNQDKISNKFEIQKIDQDACQKIDLFIEYNNKTTFRILDKDNIVAGQITTISLDQRQVKIKENDQEIESVRPEFNIEYQCLGKNYSIIQTVIQLESQRIELVYYKFCYQPQRSALPIILLLLFAICLVYLGSQYGQLEIKLFGETQNEEIGIKTAVSFIFFASLVLILLFKFPDIGEIIILIWVSIVSVFSVSSFVDDSNEYLKGFSYLFGVGLVGLYLYHRGWVLNNLLALANVLFMFRMVEIDSFRTCSILLTLAFFYDIFFVFLSPQYFGESVMAAVATRLEVPIKFIIPPFSNTPGLSCSLLGLGDILLPGIVIKYILKFERMSLTNGLFNTAIIGYSLGLIICVYVLIVKEHAQPALLYIVPCLLIPVSIVSCFKGVFTNFYKGEIRQKGSEHAYELTSEQL